MNESTFQNPGLKWRQYTRKRRDSEAVAIPCGRPDNYQQKEVKGVVREEGSEKEVVLR